MKKARILHNPGAGAGAFTKQDLLAKLSAQGLECSYSSTKKPGWQEMDDEADLVVVAGGDGTVRKVAQALVGRRLLDPQFIIGVLPLGTANNISKTLHNGYTPNEIMDGWQKQRIRKFDIGSVIGVPEQHFFIEGLGMGVFPELMKKMKALSKEYDHPKEELKSALELLYDIIMDYKPRHCRLEIDGRDYSGKYLMVEIMNIPSVGPNLFLAPDADPGDGCFDVVLVPDRDQNKLAFYVHHKTQGIEDPFDFEIVRGKKIHFQWDGGSMHVDDQLVKNEKKKQVMVTLNEGLLRFLALADKTQPPATL
ncbi:MAG: diacylglycerol kinase [Sphingobacteriales bacterium]|nr:MAG: diacylglycerol kinase [Sphingobacteriales bacterium]